MNVPTFFVEWPDLVALWPLLPASVGVISPGVLRRGIGAHIDPTAMDHTDLRFRTRRFALEIIRFSKTLPRDFVGQHIGRQLLRAGTSVGANYRAACHARSRADFIAKLGIVEEESDESGFWLELLVDSNMVSRSSAAALISEAEQILRMVCRSILTARRNRTRHTRR
jgi:four helix bundle protein